MKIVLSDKTRVEYAIETSRVSDVNKKNIENRTVRQDKSGIRDGFIHSFVVVSSLMTMVGVNIDLE